MINDDVAAPLAVFPVGLYRTAGAGQDAGQESMVEVFLIIMVTDGLVEQFIDLCGQRFRVTGPHGVKQGGQIPGLGALVKPFLDGRLKNFPDFRIGNDQGGGVLWQWGRKIVLPDLCQVTSQIENAPQILF